MMKLFKFILISILALFIINACEEVNEGLLGDVSGQVLDYKTMEPVGGVIITTTPPSQSVMTSDDGRFSVEGLPEGDYTINAKKFAYKNGSASVNVKDGQSSKVIIQLEEDDGTSSEVQFSALSPGDETVGAEVNLTLSWSVDNVAISDVNYHLKLYSSESSTAILDISSITDTFYVVEALEYNKTHFWLVSAEKEDKQIGQSPLVSFSTMTKPDIRYIYVSDAGTGEMYCLGSAGDNKKLLSENTVNNVYPSKNPVTDEVLFSALYDSEPYLYTVNLSGGGLKRISSLPVAGFHNFGEGFCWSPNGNEIVFPYYDKLYKLNKDGSGLNLLANAPAGRNFAFCDWSAEANKIVVQTRGVDISTSEFYLMNSDGSGLTLVMEDVDGRIEYPSFSQDGKKILFSMDYSGVNSLNGRQLDARIVELILDTNEILDLSGNKPSGTNDLQPKYSPDGSKIIFVNASNTGEGSRDIYVMDSDGSNRELYFTGGVMPEWF